VTVSQLLLCVVSPPQIFAAARFSVGGGGDVTGRCARAVIGKEQKPSMAPTRSGDMPTMDGGGSGCRGGGGCSGALMHHSMSFRDLERPHPDVSGSAPTSVSRLLGNADAPVDKNGNSLPPEVAYAGLST